MSNPLSRRDTDLYLRGVIAVVGVAIFAVMHFVASFAAFSISFGLGMDRFDNGGEPSTLERICDVATSILWFPAWKIAEAADIHNDLAEWGLVIGNSIMWGALMFAAFIAALRNSQIRHFSLRTLLVAVTLIAVLLGMIATFA